MVTSHGIARFCIPRRTTGLKAHLGGGDGGDNGGGGGGYAGGGGEGEGGGGGGLGEGDWPAIKAAAACKGYQGIDKPGLELHCLSGSFVSFPDLSNTCLGGL